MAQRDTDSASPTSGAAPDALAFLSSVRSRVDAALEDYLPVPSEGAPQLAEAMRYSVFAGGKRLRPALALAGCAAVDGDAAAAVPFACALELVHTYSLIHDDLPAMDDDDLRRGRPTSHKVYGDAMAILAGDALHTFAFHLLLQETPDARIARKLCLELAEAAGFQGMVGGQVEDLAADHVEPNVERLEHIHAQKTAALIRAATRGGGIAAGAPREQVHALGIYGQHLGLAFQITDDILDETGTAQTLGKTPGKDRRGEKMTFVALEGIERARARAEREVEQALGSLSQLPSPGLLRALAEFVIQRDR